MKNVRALNQLTMLVLGLTAIVLICYLVIFFVPSIPLNPFQPVARQVLVPATPTATATGAPPPTWTWTPMPSITPVRPTNTPVPTLTPRPTRTPTLVPTPTINPLIPTRSPFKFTASRPVLTSDPYGAACGNWGGVGGQVLDVDGSPLKGVNVVGWGGPIDEQGKLVYVSGSNARINKFYNGDGAYELYIGAPGDFEFNVAVYENGRPVSPIVKVKMINDCRFDLALINFQRNH